MLRSEGSSQKAAAGIPIAPIKPSPRTQDSSIMWTRFSSVTSYPRISLINTSPLDEGDAERPTGVEVFQEEL